MPETAKALSADGRGLVLTDADEAPHLCRPFRAASMPMPVPQGLRPGLCCLAPSALKNKKYAALGETPAVPKKQLLACSC
jgi:hypothetical protein